VIKVSPAIGNSIPSVAMDDGALSPVVIGPIANPINAHAASAHNCRDHGRPPSMRMPHDERRQCKDLTHRQIDLAANQRQTLDDPLATSRSSLGHNTEVSGSLRPSRLGDGRAMAGLGPKAAIRRAEISACLPQVGRVSS
jgi:hypothetical protein